MLHCDESELTPHNNDVYINGIKVDEELCVVTYHNSYYFSVDMLRNHISDKFISLHDKGIRIRRIEIDTSSLLQNNSRIYIEFNALMQYVSINNNVYESNGSMYIDCMLPASSNIGGARYYLTNEKSESSKFDYRMPDMVLNDGRGAWRKGNCFFIEDDWDHVYKYLESQDQIS